MFQLIYGVALARRLGSRRILAPGNTVFAPIQELDLGATISLNFRKDSVRWKRWSLTGLFMRGPSVHLCLNTLILGIPNELSNAISPRERDWAIEAVREKWRGSNSKPLAPSHLVIHLRAGDVFGANPNPLYGQPPLGFYRLVLDIEKWTQVTIVREDNRHPLESEIINLVSSLGIECNVRSGALESDVAFLQSAHTVVSSRGTFLPAVIALSSNARRVFFFGSSEDFHSAIDLITVEDLTGNYWQAVCADNWANTELQLDLMRDYPTENLVSSGGKGIGYNA